jgi:hypothetical protein
MELIVVSEKGTFLLDLCSCMTTFGIRAKIADQLTKESEKSMALRDNQKRLARRIDKYVSRILAQGGGDEKILQNMYDHMGTFKKLLDTSTPAEMNELCQRYEGFYRFAKLLEIMAQGIQDGVVEVPDIELSDLPPMPMSPDDEEAK